MQNVICSCDVCGAEKRAENRWYLLSADDTFRVEPWGDSTAPLSGHEHICGQECLHKRLSQWLETNSRPAPANSQEAV